MTMKKQMLMLALAATVGTVQAADYKYVLLHGFQPSQLQNRPDAATVTANGEAYWQDFWLQHASARIDWPSHERIEGKIATDYLWPKLQQMSRDNLCASGCVLVTHSTGDLVARYVLENQANWLRNAGLQPLNIIATFDFAGAGGGSELADLALNVADGKAGSLMKRAVQAWLGFEPTRANVGVLNDLSVNTARALVSAPQNRVPRIRFIGGGTDYYWLTDSFLPGQDDGVVASHSSCGAAKPLAYVSCSNQVDLDGKIGSTSDAVTSFMPNHVPLLMALGYSHFAMVAAKTSGKYTTAASSVNYGNGRLTIATKDEKARWPFSGTYRYVVDSAKTPLSALVQKKAL
jgi:hypothetical protein